MKSSRHTSTVLFANIVSVFSAYMKSLSILATDASLTPSICNFLCFHVNRDYVNRYFFYKQKSWQCETTGKSGLTYEEALESEHKEKSMVANKFPPQLRKPLLEFSQFRK